LGADAKSLVENGRIQSQNHQFVYNEGIKVQALTQTISDQMLNFGEGDPSNRQKPMARPYGVALLIAGVDETGPVIFHTDPSGTMIEYQAKGIGAAEEGIQSLLLEHYKNTLTLVEAEKLALNCLKQVMEENITNTNVELVVVPTSTKKYTQRDT
jgi:20S proteasome subunit alpha 5